MIKKIIGNEVFIQSRGKPAGRYTFADFSDDELEIERELLMNKTLLMDKDESEPIHDMVGKINDILHIRKKHGMAKRVIGK